MAPLVRELLYAAMGWPEGDLIYLVNHALTTQVELRTSTVTPLLETRCWKVVPVQGGNFFAVMG